jgi:hypothetical protein
MISVGLVKTIISLPPSNKSSAIVCRGWSYKVKSWSVYAQRINQLSDPHSVRHFVEALPTLLQQPTQVGQPPLVLVWQLSQLLCHHSLHIRIKCTECTATELHYKCTSVQLIQALCVHYMCV